MLWLYIRLGVRSEITGWTRTLERLYCLWKCVLSQKKGKKFLHQLGYTVSGGVGGTPQTVWWTSLTVVLIFMWGLVTLKMVNSRWVNIGLTSV